MAQIAGPKDTDEFIRVGWPAGGGVWVLKTTLRDACDRSVAVTHNAYNMEERCKAIEQVGGGILRGSQGLPRDRFILNTTIEKSPASEKHASRTDLGQLVPFLYNPSCIVGLDLM